MNRERISLWIYLSALLACMLAFGYYWVTGGRNHSSRPPEFVTREQMRSVLSILSMGEGAKSIGENLYVVFSRYPGYMIDRWGRPMALDIESSSTIRLVSLGRDGKLGTRDDLVESVVVTTEPNLNTLQCPSSAAAVPTGHGDDLHKRGRRHYAQGLGRDAHSLDPVDADRGCGSELPAGSRRPREAGPDSFRVYTRFGAGLR